MKYKKLILLILSVFITFTSCKKTETPIIPTVPTTYTKSAVEYKAINGVAPNLLSLDIYHFGQTTPNTPIVIWDWFFRHVGKVT